MDDWRKIGIGLSTAGAFFTILGVLMFFDKALLAMGNVRASSDCCRCRKRAAHSCLQDHLSYDPTSHVRPQLLSDFFPIALGLMRNMPVIGSILSWSPVRAVRQQLSNSAHAFGSSSLPPPSPARYMRSAWL